MIGGRFHYALRYDLKTKDGVVLPESDLWMQATYRGRNFADPREMASRSLEYSL